MVIVKLIGGLGNQLFQYAFGKYLAALNETELYLDKSGFSVYKLHDYSLNHFDIDEKFVDPLFVKKITHRFSPWRYLPTNKIIRENEALPKINYKKKYKYRTNYFEGYWQSERFFEEIKDELRKDFRLKTSLSNDNIRIADLMKKSNSISLHIRRGDYINNKTTNSVHGVCDVEYYKRAISYINERVEKPIFFVFSDDMPWCKANLSFLGQLVFCDQNSAATNYADLYLMSQCNHNIIANSSFSWWGAWLNPDPDKIVIAPQAWFADPERNRNTVDLIPQDWKRI